MSKKIISLLLLAVMLMSAALTSCSSLDEDYEEETSSVPEITLTFYGIKGEGTTDAAIEAVEAEINKYTEKQYKTTLELHLYEEDEYDDAMEQVHAKLLAQAERDELAEEAANAAAKAARLAAKKLSTEDQKEKKRAQRAYEKWAEDNAVEDEVSVEMEDDVVLDIYLMQGFENYVEAADNETLADVSSAASGTYKQIYKYVNPIIIGAAKRNGMLFGVPTNKKLDSENGKPFYYAIRTDLAEKYGLTVKEDEVVTIGAAAIKAFYAQVKENESCAVLLAPPTAPQNFDFFYDDMNTYPSFIARNIESASITVANLEYTFDTDPETAKVDLEAGLHTKNYFNSISEYRRLGYFAPDGATADNTDFAVGFFQGDLDEVKAQLGDKADDYSYCIYKRSRVRNEDVFSNMLVVSSTCKYSDRAFQVIAGLHTVPALRNLITYGIENVNYEVNEDGKTIKRLNNDWNVDFELYGNSLIGYVPEELGADYQEEAIEYNKGVKVSAFLGYKLGLDEEHDIEAFEKINAVAREYIDSLMYGVEDTKTVFAEINTKSGKYANVLGLFGEPAPVPVDPDVEVEDSAEGEEEEEEEEADFTPSYFTLLNNLNGDFSAFASGRPVDLQVPTNDFLSVEEEERLALLEAQAKQEQTTEETAEDAVVEE